MNFSVDKNQLLKHLSYTQGVVDSKSTMIILSHILFSAKDGKLFLSSTDLESSTHTSLPINIIEPGDVCLPAKKILDIIDKIPDKDIKISKNNSNQIEIDYKKGKTKIKCLPAEDFPQIPKPNDFIYTAIKSQMLNDLIQKTSYSIGSDDLRKNLTGIFFDMTNSKKIKLVSTDGHRMSTVEDEFENNSQIESFLLSKKAATELKKFALESEVVQIGTNKNFFICDNGQTSILSRLIDVKFPDYAQVVPSAKTNTFRVDRNEMLSLLQRVSVVLSEKTKGARISIGPQELEIKTTSDDGETTELISIKERASELTDAVLEVGFNVRYLIDALSSFAEEEVSVCINDEVSPACIYSEQEGEIKQLAVIMPMRV